MSPTWSAFTLLLLSTIMLLVTWTASSRRLSQLGGESTQSLKEVQDAQNVLLVRFIGLTLALSGVVLMAIITVLSDSVSNAWCKLHGILIYSFSFLATIHLVGLSMTLWISQFLSSSQYEVPQWVRQFTPVSIGVTVFFALVVALFGTFEQQTLFCFVYQPITLNMVLFKVPMLMLATLSLFFSGNAGLQLVRLQPVTLQAFLKNKLGKYSKMKENDLQQAVASNNEQYVSSQRDYLEAEKRFDEMSISGVPVQFKETGPIITFSQIQGKATLMVFLLSLAGFAVMIYELMGHPTHSRYYQGKDALTGISSDDPETHVHESRIGEAVFFLSGVGIFLFSLLGTDRAMWEMRDNVD